MTTADTQAVVTPTDSRNGLGRLCVQRLVGRHSWALLINANCLDVRDEMAAAQVVIT